MAETHKLAEKDYIKGMKYKDIAAKHGVSINTVKSWKRRYGWQRKKGAPKEKNVHTKKVGAPKGSKNALGNKGGAVPKGNSNAVTHGLFAKYLPEETLDIVNDIDSISLLDILWMNIKMQFAQIMRAQQIMFVKDQDDLTKELKKSKYEVISWVRRSSKFQLKKNMSCNSLGINRRNFFKILRAMGELRSMLKQFYELAHADDYRLLEL
ncbi:phage terminase small subunit [Virgibacillus salarius]|uniref:phage terminase small subunit n=1 Tax=Virgibacillus salarius TaxID=447199 RepID=UPI002490EFB9|nr:phage terminase small subunit [Virgibacillus salarius]WBX79944.1 phage terminase small subunit [Virgibacillus salarius]